MRLKLLSLLALLLSATLPTLAYDFEAANADGVTIYYDINDDGQSVSVTYNFDLNSIFEDDFNMDDLASCYSGNVAIPESVYYKGITYPVTGIDGLAFYNCIGLTEVTIPTSIIEIDSGAFYGCSDLTTVNYNAIACEIMGSWEDHAFIECDNLTTLNIGREVKKIRNYAFYGCETVKVVNFNAVDFECNDSYIGPLDVLTNLSTLNIGDEVTVIGPHTFSGCYMEIISFGKSVTSIGDYAFSGCENLTSLTIPNTVKTIGEYAFSGCENLIAVTIPDSVTSIGDHAFEDSGIYNNESNWENGVLYISDWAIEAKKDLSGSCAIKEGTVGIAEEAFDYSVSLESLTMGNSVKYIGEEAFRGCEALTSATISDSVISIGDSAFGYCTKLKAFYGKPATADHRCLIIDGVLIAFAPAGITSYNIPSGVTIIGSEAFYCSELVSVTIPNSVKTIGSYAFGKSFSLTSVVIPNSVTSIDEMSFYHCENLSRVVIGSSVEKIGDRAFDWCDNLKEVYVMAQTPPVPEDDADDIFSGNAYSNATLYVPKGKVEVYKAANPWKYFKNIAESDFAGVDSVESDCVVAGDVYNMQGVCVKRAASADDLRALPSGLYIRNGKKVIVR